MPFICRKYISRLLQILAVLSGVLAIVSETFPVTHIESPSLSKCWEYKVDTSEHGAVASDDRRVFVGTENGSVHAIDAVSSEVIWNSELGGNVSSDLFEFDGSLFVVSKSLGSNGSESATLRSLSTTTGIPLWSRSISTADHVYLGYSDGSIIAVANDGTLTAVSLSSGTHNWTKILGEPVATSPFYFQNTIVIATKDRKISTVSSETGSLLGHFQTKFVPSAITGGDKFMFVGDERGNIAKVDSGTGRVVWNYKSGGAITRLTVTDNGLLVSSLDNFIYLISPNSGHVIWKRRMPGRVVEGGVILDKYIFALVYGESTGFLIDPENGKPIGKLERGDHLSGEQPPLPVGDWNVLFSASNGIALYSLRQCGNR